MRRAGWRKPTWSTVQMLTDFCLDQMDLRKWYYPENLNTGQVCVGNFRFIHLSVENVTVFSSKVHRTAAKPLTLKHVKLQAKTKAVLTRCLIFILIIFNYQD